MKRYEKKFSEKVPKNVKHILYGIHEYAKTFGIITAENPMGKKLSHKENMQRNRKFYELLKRGRYQYLKIQGKYGNKEDPVLIINIPEKELLYYGDKYEQESVIYGEVLDYREVRFEYWEREAPNSPLIKKDEIDKIDILNNPDDFYSWTRGWKFTIPFSVFQESLTEWYSQKIQILSEERKKEIKSYINRIVERDESFTGTHFYRLRGEVNRIINEQKREMKLIKETIPKAPAYWISPTGKILPVYEDNHIAQVIKNPKAFNMTIEEIEEIYDKENETMGSEGKARKKIILNLIRRGWIRIRRYHRPDMFSVNVPGLNKKVKNYLYQWSQAMKDLGLKYTPVKIDMPDKVLHYSIDEISNDVLFQESVLDKYDLVVVESVEDL